jgi:hypothetical protein
LLVRHPFSTCRSYSSYVERPHIIDLAGATELTSRWRAQRNATKAGRFRRAALDRLLAHPAAAGIRVYLGAKPDGSWTFVMVATTSAGQDILPDAGTTPEASGLAEEAHPCPPDCDSHSPLFGDNPRV